MWQYVWFKIYLDLKDPLSYTGPEQFASSLMIDKQVCACLKYDIIFSEFCKIEPNKEKFVH